MAFIRRTKKRHCQLCQSHTERVDYKDVELIKTYTNAIGKIQPRRITGACSMHQRRVANAIKRARIVALLPFIKE